MDRFLTKYQQVIHEYSSNEDEVQEVFPGTMPSTNATATAARGTTTPGTTTATSPNGQATTPHNGNPGYPYSFGLGFLPFGNYVF